jgi:hypothetical protein
LFVLHLGLLHDAFHAKAAALELRRAMAGLQKRVIRWH